jgi:hypothetical protein
VLALWPAAPALAATQLSFTSTTFPISGVSPAAGVASDFDNDNDLDLATANEGGGVSVLLADGKGGFTDNGVFQAGQNPISLDVGEFNGDGNVDLVVANHSSGDISVLRGEGNGTFSESAVYPITGCGSADAEVPDAVKVGFFNADARPDLVVANFGCNSMSILLGEADGTFGPATNIATVQGPDALATGDVNQDGKLDVVLPSGDIAGASVLLGKGDGTFNTAAEVFTGASLFPEVAVGDISGDG